MQKLIIENLGPVKKIELDITQVNLFIGEQATGKSTISKCVYFFKSIKNIVVEDIYSKVISAEKDSSMIKYPSGPLVEFFVGLFGHSWDLNEDMYLKYSFEENIFVEIRFKHLEVDWGKEGKNYLNFHFSTDLSLILKDLENDFLARYSFSKNDDNLSFSFINAERARCYSEISASLNEIFDDDKEIYYIPAGRNLLTLMFNQKTQIDYNSLDVVNRNFMRFIESIQSKFDMGIGEVHKYYPNEERSFDVEKHVGAIKDCLKGNYYFNKGKEYLLLDTDEEIKINFASSGQQELLWLLLQLYVLLLKEEKAFVIIEEPEAHLYPSVQKHVFDYIVHFANLNKSGVLVTTHSPYILMAANNLYKAGALYSADKKEQVNKLLGKNRHIAPNSFTAVKLLEQGRHENLLNEQTAELEISLIDEISDEINKVYSELFYLEDNYDDSK